MQLENYLDDKLTQSEATTKEYFDARFDQLEWLIKDGFPNGDPRGHREVHEQRISDAKMWKERREALIKQVLTGSAYATIIYLATIVWSALKHEVQR